MIRLQQKNNFRTVLIIWLLCLSIFSKAQVSNPALVGYFQNWQDTNSPYLQLDAVDPDYNIINVAFAVPQAGTDYNMTFIPDQVSQATFISQIQTLQAQGRKVNISIGGEGTPVSLDNITERDVFINSMTGIVNTYGFDGIDIDLEGSSLSITGGTIAAPTDPPIINLIYAIKKIMQDFYTLNHHRLILTIAPETAFVQGGQSAYGGIWGAYLPVIDALRDSIEILHVQLYNSGTMYGIDGNIYTQGTADFIVAMCEAVIHGFNTPGGMFTGLPANKVAAGLPACSMAAGGGYTNTSTVKAAIDYLRGNGNQPGAYVLTNTSGYPLLRGMMTWSINWDATATCGNIYDYAINYQSIFGTVLPVELISFSGSNYGINNLLNWQTNHEVNSNSFIIERSIDSRNFDSISTVIAAGNSMTTKSYYFTDQHLISKTNYYRLKQIGNDGNFTYSNIITLSGKQENAPEIVIYPNPAKNDFIILTNPTFINAELKIYDLSGQLIYSGKLNHEKIHLDTAPGMYFVVIKDEKKRILSKLIIQ